MQLPIVVNMPPMLYTDSNGQKWAVAGSNWIRVPETLTLDNVSEYMIWERTKPPEPKNVRSWEVTSSRNIGQVYTVTNDGTNWACTCAGFGWRRKCRHIKEIRNENR